jgi:hypothetical protein
VNREAQKVIDSPLKTRDILSLLSNENWIGRLLKLGNVYYRV